MWDIYDRDKLYDEVWDEPLQKVAERYEVSDVALGKVCRKLRVPLPGRGYWAKRKAGQPLPDRPKLPSLKPGKDCVVRRSGGAGRARASGSLRRSAKEFDETVKTEVKQRIRVADTLSDPHPLVEQAQRRLERSTEHKAVLSSPSVRCLDIQVSSPLLDRALRICDALLKAIEEIGLTVEVTPNPRKTAEQARSSGSVQPNTTRVYCRDEWISFRLIEEVKVNLNPGPYRRSYFGRGRADYLMVRLDPEYEATGVLCLQLTNVDDLSLRRVWRDGKKQRVENCLESFIAYLGLAAQAIKDAREAAERRRVEALEAERRRREEQERQREYQRRERELLSKLERWRLACDLRQYVAEAENIVNVIGRSTELGQKLSDELEWALKHADSVDPNSTLREAARRAAHVSRRTQLRARHDQTQPPTGDDWVA